LPTWLPYTPSRIVNNQYLRSWKKELVILEIVSIK